MSRDNNKKNKNSAPAAGKGNEAEAVKTTAAGNAEPEAETVMDADEARDDADSRRREKFEKSVFEYGERKKKRQADWDIRPYLAIGAIVFLVFCCCMGVIFVVFKYDKIVALAGKISSVLRPIIIGLIVGYLLSPLMEKIERLLLTVFLKRTKDEAKTRSRIRVISSLITVIFFLVIIGVIIALLIPALISSLTSFFSSVSGYVERYDELVAGLNVSDGVKTQLINFEQTIYDITEDISSWLMKNVFPKATTYLTTLGSGLMSVLVALKNVVVGLIVAIYVLCDKDRFEGEVKRAAYAFFPVEHANRLVSFLHKCNTVFGGFIVGKVLDSIIIGLITFIFCTCVRMPYTLLVSVVIGVTNIVPFFGPFIGGIPAFVLVLLASPWHGIVLGIFILVLQQVDGNIIGPKILGDSTGLSSFWVIFAILLGGGLWGFMGMIFGVPLFAVLYYLAKKFLAAMTEKRGMPEDSMEYTYVTMVDEKTGKLINDEERLEKLKGYNKKQAKK